MKCPVERLKIKEIRYLNSHYCKAHRMPYLSHYNCYLKESKQAPKIAMLDIESGGSFDADFGYTFSYALLDHATKKVIKSVVTQKEIYAGTFDKRLLKDFCWDVQKFDKLVVWWGKDTGFRGQRHDIPFLRTRAIEHGLGKFFPQFKEIKIIDLYDVARGKLKLHSNSLFSVCNFLGIKSKQYRIKPDIWRRALAGHTPSLAYILKHNEEDVWSTDAVFNLIYDYKPLESNI